MAEACEYGLIRGTCVTARRLEVVAVAGLLWIYFVVCSGWGGIFLCVFFLCVFFCFLYTHGLLQVWGRLASFTSLLVLLRRSVSRVLLSWGNSYDKSYARNPTVVKTNTAELYVASSSFIGHVIHIFTCQCYWYVQLDLCFVRTKYQYTTTESLVDEFPVTASEMEQSVSKLSLSEILVLAPN